MKIGFIGFGAAACSLALGLGSEGIHEMLAYRPGAGDTEKDRLRVRNAQAAGVRLVSDLAELAGDSDIIFSAVPPTFSLAAAREARDHLSGRQIYVDITATTPALKKEIWAELKGSGVRFVDAAVLGGLPKEKHRVPIAASGNGAEAFRELFTPFNMQISIVGEEPGAASAIKLIRSIFMKGISTLMLETLEAADHYGVSGEVTASLAASMDSAPFLDHLDRLVTGSAIHCKRRADELEGSIAMLEEAGLDSAMTRAARDRLRGLEHHGFDQRFLENRPTGWEEIIRITRKDH